MNIRLYKKCFSLPLGLLVTARFLSLGASLAMAGGKGDPLLTTVIIDQLEFRDVDDDNPLTLEGQGWIGRDLQKLWIKTDAERVDGKIEEAELQVLYSQAIAPYWDFQLGLRKDFKPSPDRSWAVIGLQGL
ncbi:MAG: copper resistance protein B, partial [Gammaproteobacteria bacterium]|nr:copper resistance protein B [Gammaproteobacteria bacterium]